MEAFVNQPPLAVQEILEEDVNTLQAIGRGEVQALDALYARYGSMLLGFLTNRLNDPHLAEEVLQDVMLAVWEHAGSFEARSQVRTWLLVIARNRAINIMRKKRPALVDLGSVFSIQSEDTGPVEALELREEQDRVRQAIRALPDVHREVLELAFYHQLSGAEIAHVLETSEGTVKSRLHRAKENLKRLLMQQG
jgi:RNA polymerase sigma-70 factor (ECF subfamily)